MNGARRDGGTFRNPILGSESRQPVTRTPLDVPTVGAPETAEANSSVGGGANNTPPSPWKKASLAGGRDNSIARQELILSEQLYQCVVEEAYFIE